MTTGTPDHPDTTGGGRRPPAGGDPSRWRAAAVGALLLLTGAALGVTVDRLWVAGARPAEAAPLTFDAMARSLDLPPRERARVRTLLDSLEEEVAAAAAAGPESLGSVARHARRRLHQVLPPDRRPAFRQWMDRHHRQMMRRMHPAGRPPMHMRMHRGDSTLGPMMGPPGRGSGMMRGGGDGRGMMRRGPGDGTGPRPEDFR